MIREHHDKPLEKKNQPVDFGDLGAPSQSGERLHWGPGSADSACDLLEVEFPPKSAEINSWNRDWAGYCPVHGTNLKPDDHDGESKHLALKTQHVTFSMWRAACGMRRRILRASTSNAPQATCKIQRVRCTSLTLMNILMHDEWWPILLFSSMIINDNQWSSFGDNSCSSSSNDEVYRLSWCMPLKKKRRTNAWSLMYEQYL